MKAVNLIPGDARRRTVGTPGRVGGAVYLTIGALVAALVLVVVYVVANNSISDRKAKIAELQSRVTRAQAEAAALKPYTQFAQLAQVRAETVRQIANTRFDWHRALSDLSKVVPANTSLQTLTGTVAPGAGVQGGVSISLRGAIPSPAFELSGCTSSQDDVARLMSRLRLMNGVSRVSLQDSVKSNTAQGGAAVSTAGNSVSTAGNSGGCGPNTPAFHVVVFFQPLPGAGPNGATNLTAQPVSSTTVSGGSK
jgi:Tfp pilus assembly protein PilN